METQNDRTVVLTVVVLLGLFAVVGLAGTIWLVHDKVDASAVAVVSTLTGTAAGSLGTLLATTRSGQPPAAVHEEGYQAALADVQSLASP